MARRRGRRNNGNSDGTPAGRDASIDWSIVFAGQGARPEQPDGPTPDESEDRIADVPGASKTSSAKSKAQAALPGATRNEQNSHDWNSVFRESATLDNTPPGPITAPVDPTAVIPGTVPTATEPIVTPAAAASAPAEARKSEDDVTVSRADDVASAQRGGSGQSATGAEAGSDSPAWLADSLAMFSPEIDHADDVTGEVYTFAVDPEPPPVAVAGDGRAAIFEESGEVPPVVDVVPADLPSSPVDRTAFSASVDGLPLPSETMQPTNPLPTVAARTTPVQPTDLPATQAPATNTPATAPIEEPVAESSTGGLEIPGGLFDTGEQPEVAPAAAPAAAPEAAESASYNASPWLAAILGSPEADESPSAAADIDDHAAVPATAVPATAVPATAPATAVPVAAVQAAAPLAAATTTPVTGAQDASAEQAEPTPTAEAPVAAAKAPNKDRFGRLELRPPKDDIELLTVRSELIGVFGAPPVRCEVNLCPPGSQLEVLSIHFDETQWTPEDADIVWDFIFDWLPKVWLILCGRPRLETSVVETWISYKAADLPGEQYLRAIATLEPDLDFDDFSRAHRDAVEQRTGGRWFDGIEVSPDY